MPRSAGRPSLCSLANIPHHHWCHWERCPGHRPPHHRARLVFTGPLRVRFRGGMRQHVTGAAHYSGPQQHHRSGAPATGPSGGRVLCPQTRVKSSMGTAAPSSARYVCPGAASGVPSLLMHPWWGGTIIIHTAAIRGSLFHFVCSSCCDQSSTPLWSPAEG